MDLPFLGCCYEITPSGFPAALIQTPVATDTTESAISTVESPKLRLCRASVSGNHQFPKPAVSTHTPREICPSKFHNNSPIPHTRTFCFTFFASSFLRGSSNSSSQHFLIRRGTSLLIHFQFAAATLQQLGQKKVRKKTEGKNKCARAYSSAELLVRSHFSNHCFVQLRCSARSGSRCCCCLLTAGVATSDDGQ